MKIVGSLRASFLVYFTACLSLGTILLCYFLALAFKHVSLWPIPMISDCAIKPPEMFPFRLGLVTSALLMALSNLVIYLAAVPRSKAALLFGEVATLCLAIVAVVNEKEASKVHGISAVIFFILYWFNMILLTVLSSKVLLPRYRPDASPLSSWLVAKLISRQTLTVLCGFGLVAAAIVSSCKCDKHQQYLAICEWFGTICILLFNLTFAGDLSDVRLSEIILQSQLVSNVGSETPETAPLVVKYKL